MALGASQPTGKPEIGGRGVVDFSAESVLKAIELFAVDGVAAGLFTGEGQMKALLQVGLRAVQVGGDGFGTCYFKKPFPGGLITAVAWGQYGAWIKYWVGNKNGFTFQGPAGANNLLAYLAIGW